MVRYLQTFLPFVNGICEDLLENSANQALEDAEEGVFEIFIYNDTIKYSKPDKNGRIETYEERHHSLNRPNVIETKPIKNQRREAYI